MDSFQGPLSCPLPGGALAFREGGLDSLRNTAANLALAWSIMVPMAPCHATDLRTVADVDRFVHEALPIGTTRSKLVEVLNERRIENSETKSPSGIVYAIIRDGSGGPLIKKSITIKFFFDETGRLAHYEVREVLTGP